MRCAKRRALVPDTGKCNVWINAKATTERDYGAGCGSVLRAR